jgi:hypothetical protein
MSSDSCALGPDGQLLPADKIAWYNDPDDTQPISASVSLVAETPSAPGPSSAFDILMHAGRSATAKVAGSRRSTSPRRSSRHSKPSAKVREAAETNEAVASSKRKARDRSGSSSHSRWVACCVTGPVLSEHSGSEFEDGVDGTATDPATDIASEDDEARFTYEELKAMNGTKASDVIVLSLSF